MSRKNDQVKVVETIPGNVARTTAEEPYQYSRAACTDHYPRPTGDAVGYRVIYNQLFLSDENNGPNANCGHWLNYYLSWLSNIAGFVEKDGYRIPFYEDDNYYSYLMDGRRYYIAKDIYVRAFQHLELLNEDARCNLITHKHKDRDRVLEYFVSLRAKRPDQRTSDENNIALKEEVWAGLLRNDRLDVRQRLLNLAKRNPAALDLFLAHCDFNNVTELNELIASATSMDFRIGQSATTKTVLDFIEFLNTLSPKNRGFFLESNHPMANRVWDQIPKLENFTVRDVQGNHFNILRRKHIAMLIGNLHKKNPDIADDQMTSEQSRDGMPRGYARGKVRKKIMRPDGDGYGEVEKDGWVYEIPDSSKPPVEYVKRTIHVMEKNPQTGDEVEVEKEIWVYEYSEMLLNTSLKDYVLSLCDAGVTFTVTDFVKLRDTALKSDDFVRVSCDGFTVNDFVYFIKSAMDTGSEQEVNGILACFFNSFMRNPKELLEAYDGTFETGSSQKKRQDTLKELYMRNETFVKVLALSRKALTLIPSERDRSVTAGEQPAHIVHEQGTGKIIHTESEFVITAQGAAVNGQLVAETPASLRDAGDKALFRHEIRLGVMQHTRALTLEFNLSELETIMRLSVKNRLDDLVAPIRGIIQKQLDEMYQAIGGGQVAGYSDPAINDQNAGELLQKFASILELIHLISHSPVFLGDHDISIFMDRFTRITDGFCDNCRQESDSVKRILFDGWKKLTLMIKSNDEQIDALFWCAHFATTSEDKSFIQATINSVIEKASALDRLDDLRAKKVLMLLFLTKTPAELGDILNEMAIRPVTRKIKSFMESLSITLGSLEEMKAHLLDFVNTHLPSVRRGNEAKFDGQLDAFLCAVARHRYQKMDCNNPVLIREECNRLLQVSRSREPAEFTRNEQKIIEALNVLSKNIEVKFILSGQEEALRQKLLCGENVLAESVAFCSKEERKKYDGLLREMVLGDRPDAVAKLVEIGADINQSMSPHGESMLFALISSVRQNPDQVRGRDDQSRQIIETNHEDFTRRASYTIKIIQNLLPRLTPENTERLFEELLRSIKLSQRASASQLCINVLSLIVLERLPWSLQKSKFNALLTACVESGKRSFAYLLAQEKPNFVDLTLLENKTKEVIISGNRRIVEVETWLSVLDIVASKATTEKQVKDVIETMASPLVPTQRKLQTTSSRGHRRQLVNLDASVETEMKDIMTLLIECRHSGRDLHRSVSYSKTRRAAMRDRDESGFEAPTELTDFLKTTKTPVAISEERELQTTSSKGHRRHLDEFDSEAPIELTDGPVKLTETAMATDDDNFVIVPEMPGSTVISDMEKAQLQQLLLLISCARCVASNPGMVTLVCTVACDLQLNLQVEMPIRVDVTSSARADGESRMQHVPDATLFARSASLFKTHYDRKLAAGGKHVKSALPDQQSQTDRQWLLQVFAHGAHETGSLREKGQRTRETLELLGWVRNGRVTDAAPIEQRELNEHRRTA